MHDTRVFTHPRHLQMLTALQILGRGRNLSFLVKYRDSDIMAMVYTLTLPCCYLSARRA